MGDSDYYQNDYWYECYQRCLNCKYFNYCCRKYIFCPPGPPIFQDDKGERGCHDPQGKLNPRDFHGPQGDSGIQGPPGSYGDPGIQSPPGPQGDSGVQGLPWPSSRSGYSKPSLPSKQSGYTRSFWSW